LTKNQLVISQQLQAKWRSNNCQIHQTISGSCKLGTETSCGMATLKFSKMQPSTSDLIFTGRFLRWSRNSLVNFLPVSLTVLTAAERRAGVQIWRHLNITHLASSWQHAVAQVIGSDQPTYPSPLEGSSSADTSLPVWS
jgi:hypothetical protein